MIIVNFIFILNIISKIRLINNSAEVSPSATNSQHPKNYKIVFVSALFRHGDCTPVQLYPDDPNSKDDFDPPGLGNLTSVGKERARQLGVVLRQRYDNLLSKSYKPNEVIARSTDKSRTKISLAMVLKGLYPNQHQISISYFPQKADILLSPSRASVKYLEVLKKIFRKAEMKGKMKGTFSLLQKLVREYPGSTIYSFRDLYHSLVAESNMGLKIPQWAQNNSAIQQLENIVVKNYQLASFTTDLRRLNGGVLLKNITETMIGIVDGIIQDGRKIQLFSGHEATVAAFLLTLGVFSPHVPKYCSCVMVELLQDDEGHYYVGIRYNLGIPQETTILTIPGCTDPCPLEKFVQLMKDLIPIDDDIIASSDLIEKKLVTSV